MTRFLSEGDRIHASIGKSVLHIFNKKINELGVYLMANFIVCQNKERFNTTKHRLMLTFTQRTTVAEIIDPLFPMNIFELRPYHQLINKVDVNESELFDVIGEIVNFSEVQTQKQVYNRKHFPFAVCPDRAELWFSDVVDMGATINDSVPFRG
uniref:Uncharacterized protein LOC104235184 n=1 Tax=Nicotiana sylvestris TaxID=4096 RepID=A0A1U7XJR2_NICSY|nr:PREDICTED: uncharacterized protein LOC104235184 [Nicotiana sylvestris]XP_009787186.1 PREDICTED: uncharacterized protein LOC104235184 [Nicotiana sylvestris]XP_009787187.1 PREDICTED: uncharacterized protein LOC104235184 [Nicotiana sylvestris]XP_009787188.1 PREDICTED: uncharacterized protein LOC104235184 [Nicotiana sylvestris]XP_009787189.1 PREDICTED: uncharacterized protein LOC104235184 [Nicotiana sylvestris]